MPWHSFLAGLPWRFKESGAVAHYLGRAHRRYQNSSQEFDEVLVTYPPEADLWPEGDFVTTHLIVTTDFLSEHPAAGKALSVGLGDAVDSNYVTIEGLKIPTKRVCADLTVRQQQHVGLADVRFNGVARRISSARAPGSRCPRPRTASQTRPPRRPIRPRRRSGRPSRAVIEKRPTTTRESARLEAFSDGVFAIAIAARARTQVPPFDAALGPALFERWPRALRSSGAARSASCQPHRLFARIKRVDPAGRINGFLLLGVTFLPFPTALIAEHFAGKPGDGDPCSDPGADRDRLQRAPVLSHDAGVRNALEVRQTTGAARSSASTASACRVSSRSSARAGLAAREQAGLILFALYFALPPRKLPVG